MRPPPGAALAGAADLGFNPPTCGPHGWAFLLTVSYTTGTEKYAAYGRCHS